MRCSKLLLLLLLFNITAGAQKLVMPGDHPDPSVVKIGDTYWASATTSNWFPAYPLMKSKDLVNWSTIGYAFNQMPGWADYYFWAPEISYENGKVYIYYSAHKKNGNLCVGVASADKPEGPYRDHGTLICQEVGSIDAFPMRDENGKLHLIWKEDGNSVGKPTPIWIMEMNEERTALIGEKKEMFRNDATWEGNLVEGVSMIRHNGYFYAFYAAAACCGRGCTYASGIARSKSLFGPWEKYQKNPVLVDQGQWKCAGHGTPVEKDGKYYFLYHAYDTTTHVYTGRQGLLIEFRFTPDGWIEFPTTNIEGNVAKSLPIIDEFKGKRLAHQWQWSVFQPAAYTLKGGCLRLKPWQSAPLTFMGQKTYSGNYTASAVINTKRSTAVAGLGAIGDEQNSISALFRNDTLSLLVIREGKQLVVRHQAVNAGKQLHLNMTVMNGKDLIFRFSADGKNFTTLNQQPADGSFLPPWDRAVRVGLIAAGDAQHEAVFERFEMKPNDQ